MLWEVCTFVHHLKTKAKSIRFGYECQRLGSIVTGAAAKYRRISICCFVYTTKMDAG